MNEKQSGLKLDDEQLETISGGLGLNMNAFSNRVNECPTTATCSKYEQGSNGFIGNRVMNTCSSCGHYIVGSSTGCSERQLTSNEC